MSATQSTPTTRSPADVPFIVKDRRRKGFFTIDNELLDRFGAQLKAHGLAVYMALARFANQEGACWPSLLTIAKKTGVSRPQVIREIAKLKALNLIAVEHQVNDKGEHSSNLYILLDISPPSPDPGVVSDRDQGSLSQRPPLVSTGDHRSLSQRPKQHKENKTQFRNKTQRTSSIPIVINNNSGDQSEPTAVVVASSLSLVQEPDFVLSEKNTSGEWDQLSASEPECPTPPMACVPPAPEGAVNQAAEQALLAIGIGKMVAHRLATRYSAERIAEKLEFLAFLQDERPDTVQNPRGWLRKAIEEDYGPPDGFSTAEERAQEEVEAAREEQWAAAAAQSHQAFAAQVQERQEARRRQLQAEYGTTEEAYQLWAEVLTVAKYGHPGLYDLYARAQILRVTGETVLLGFEHEGILRKLDHPGTMMALKRHLKLIAKRPLEVETVLLPVEVLGRVDN